MADLEKKIKLNIHNFRCRVNILEKNGYRVGSKHVPTKKKDYKAAIYVPLVDRIPVSVTFAEVVGTDSGLDIYAIIKAGVNNKILSIEYQ